MSTVDTTLGENRTHVRRSRRPPVAVALAAIALLVAGFLTLTALTQEDEQKGGKLEGSSKDSFTLRYPDGWRPLSNKRLDALPGSPLAVLRREHGRGYVVLRREKRAPRDFQRFSAQLTGALQSRVPDFQRQSSRVVKTRAGRAFFYSYIRKKRGTVHGVLVVPAGNRSYALNSVSAGSSKRVAREIARILLSFRV